MDFSQFFIGKLKKFELGAEEEGGGGDTLDDHLVIQGYVDLDVPLITSILITSKSLENKKNCDLLFYPYLLGLFSCLKVPLFKLL